MCGFEFNVDIARVGRDTDNCSDTLRNVEESIAGLEMVVVACGCWIFN